MTPTIPHFDLPFRFGTAGGNAAVVQQDSVKDVRNCVEACIRTDAGSRLYVPQFGVDDPTFRTQPLDMTQLHAQIVLNEPRADVIISSHVDELSPMINDILVEVGNNV